MKDVFFSTTNKINLILIVIFLRMIVCVIKRIQRIKTYTYVSSKEFEYRDLLNHHQHVYLTTIIIIIIIIIITIIIINNIICITSLFTHEPITDLLHLLLDLKKHIYRWMIMIIIPFSFSFTSLVLTLLLSFYGL